MENKTPLSAAAAPVPVAPVPAAAPLSAWVVDLGWSWYNKYYFRGLDILKAISPHESASGIFDNKLNLTLKQERSAESIGFDYIEALQKQITNGAAVQLPPNPGARRTEEHFLLPPRQRYAEFCDIYMKASYDLIPGQLRAVGGFNRYAFSNGTFYAKGGQPINYADEITVKLEYLGIPSFQGFNVKPSLEWAHDFDGFEGDFFELRLDGDYELYKQANAVVHLNPYASLTYDMSYNGPASSLLKSGTNTYTFSHPGPDNGWNSFALGLNIPIRIGENFSVSLSGNYNFAIEDTGGQARASNGFWGGVQAHVSFGGPLNSPPLAPDGKSDGKNDAKLVQEPIALLPWEVTADVAGERFNYGFSNVTLPPFVVSSLGLPSATPHPVVNRSFGTAFNDQDTVEALDLSLSRELWRSGDWSVRAGLQYEYTRSEGDSGIRLARFDTGIVTLNPAGTVTEKVNVATFVNSKVSVTSNRLDFPIKLRHDFGKRLHAELAAALTVNIPSEDLTVNAYERALTDETVKSVVTPGVTTGAPMTVVTARSPFGGGTVGMLPPGAQVIYPPTATTVTTSGSTTVVPPTPLSISSGKGGAASVAPQLPGVGVGHQAFNNSSTALLLGVSGSLSLIYDINASGTLFTNAWARYDWASDVELATHPASSSINRNGASFGLGVGYRF